MGDTDRPIRQPELAAERLAASTLRDTYYRPLVRLAALLTGDAGLAETVACAALGALRSRSLLRPEPTADAVRYLQQQVIVRCRRQQRSRGTLRIVPASRDVADFALRPVVRALQELPPRGREAVVLTHYLDLSEQQAAVAAGVTLTVLRDRLGQAMRTLHDRFADE
jgi:DNA-directed RNA polymerase specialized sigma24 family protein